MDQDTFDVHARMLAMESSLAGLTAMLLMCTKDPRGNMAAFASDAGDSMHLAALSSPGQKALFEAVAQRIELHWDNVATALSGLMNPQHDENTLAAALASHPADREAAVRQVRR